MVALGRVFSQTETNECEEDLLPQPDVMTLKSRAIGQQCPMDARSAERSLRRSAEVACVQPSRCAVQGHKVGAACGCLFAVLKGCPVLINHGASRSTGNCSSLAAWPCRRISRDLHHTNRSCAFRRGESQCELSDWGILVRMASTVSRSLSY
jgi:hypothetical protein